MRTLRFAVAGLTTATMLTTLSLGATSAVAATTVASCQSQIASLEKTSGTLTIATDNPGYTPWFVNNKPTNGKGYESAVGYAIAKTLGVAKKNVKWVTEAFDNSYAPGAKNFDFDLNEISYTADRAKAVDLSVSYYDVQQSIVALKGSAITKKHTPAELKTYKYGDQIGTTGLAFINNQIMPTTPARVYSTLDAAVAALQSHQIDAIVIDTPSGQYMASAQIVNKKGKSLATQVGQFPSTGEHYSALLQKGSKLTACVNAAIAQLNSNGTIAKLQKKWLNIYTSVPKIKP